MIYEITILATSVVAALLTQELSIPRRFGAVRASAIVSLIFSLAIYIFPSSNAVLVMPPVAMGASFVAMSSRKAIPNRRWMLVAGLVFSFVFLLTSPSLEGYGGVLGTGACVSVIMTVGVREYSKFLRKISRN